MEQKEENDIEEKEEGSKQRIEPVRVVYCAVCGLPPEYCEFGPNFEKCKPWLRENFPDLYPNLLQEEGEGITHSLSCLTSNVESKDEKGSSSKRGGKGILKPETDGEVKKLPGGKVKVKEKPIVHITKTARNKKKFVTTVAGLDKFGIKLSEASKLMAKKFSCGASVVKTPEGTEEIDVQGDFMDDLIEFLEEKFKISEDDVVTEDKSVKKKSSGN